MSTSCTSPAQEECGDIPHGAVVEIEYLAPPPVRSRVPGDRLRRHRLALEEEGAARPAEELIQLGQAGGWRDPTGLLGGHDRLRCPEEGAHVCLGHGPSSRSDGKPQGALMVGRCAVRHAGTLVHVSPLRRIWPGPGQLELRQGHCWLDMSKGLDQVQGLSVNPLRLATCLRW